MRVSLLWSLFGLPFIYTAVAQSPISPERALQSFETADNLVVELVAAEPLVASPCAMAFDERGRLFVAENRGYPRGPAPGEPSAGSIALLEDSDGDGRMDKRTAFADQLTFPNGVMPWKDGLLVTCAPDLLYLRDTDGDGKADQRRVLLTGFDTDKSTQLRVNGPLLAPDGWIWLASGLSGGKICNPEHPEFGTLDLKSDVRFDPESGRFEAVDGRSQYGHSFDEFGRRFICMNRIQVQHVVLPSAALRRNPHLAFSDTVQNCPELVPNPLLRGGGGAARIFPISSNITTADSHAGTFSAACAVTIWPGGALPDSYRGYALSCDPTGNLVHLDRLEPRGATFTAVAAFSGRELLASRDDWFRPVALASGPDGALYVCDMYRKVIEHPDYLPEEVRKHTDFEAGKDYGRIWRLSHKAPARVQTRFASDEPTSSLLKRLGSRNGWERLTAYRLLIEQQDALNRAETIQAFQNAKDSGQAAALLSILAQLDALEEPVVRQAKEHSSPDVREQIARLTPAVARDLAHDGNPRVRFASALALAENPAVARVEALAAIARKDAADRWVRAAIVSSAAGIEEELLTALLDGRESPDLSIVHSLAQIIGKRVASGDRDSKLSKLLHAAGSAQDPAVAIAAGFAESARGLPSVASNPELERIITTATSLTESSSTAQLRLLAIGLLGFTDFERASAPLIGALDAADPQTQNAAVKAISQLPGPEGTRTLLEPARWKRFSPGVRQTILSTLCSRPHLTRTLLDALEAGSLAASDVDSLSRRQLIKSPDARIRERAGKLFAEPAAGDRRHAFELAKASLQLKPHPANGREVFRRACAVCHRIEREGSPVGPDLFDIRNQPKESILLHIVVPDHEIAPGFAAYSVATKDGRIMMGVIASETPESITIRQPGGQEETLSRSTILTLSANPGSLMPAGLEKAITEQEMADLIAYLRGEQ